MARLLTVLAALALLLPGAASAQDPVTNAPPGNSAIDEYLETVPGATGDVRPGAPTDSGALPSAQRAALERLGPDGRLLADIVEATGGKPAANGKQGATAAPAAAEEGGRSPLAATVTAALGGDDESGLGLALPLLLLASLAGAIALAILWRRSAA
jgi:hypothetical protein